MCKKEDNLKIMSKLLLANYVIILFNIYSD
jgi:hypothetical protein